MNRIFAITERFFPWSNAYGIARSLLAFGTFTTLLFNTSEILFKSATVGSDYCDSLGISLFCLIDDLEVSRYISMILLLPVILGWRPMFTGLFHWWVTYSFANSAQIVDGGDHIASILTLLLLPVTLTDSRKWHWITINENQSTNLVRAIRCLFALSSLIVIKIQVSIVYLNSAVAKLQVKEWVDGTAIYYWFKHPIFGHPKWLNFLIEPLLYNGTILFIITWGAILFEFILFAGLFMDERLRKWLLIMGIFFHFSIFIIHGLASFFFTMAASLILYLTSIGTNVSLRFFSRVKLSNL